MNKWVLVTGGLVLCIVFGAPFVVYWRTGHYPKGFPLQAPADREPSQSSPDAKTSSGTESAAYVRQEVSQTQQLNGFLPFYYEQTSQPDLAQLKEWGATAVNIIVEDAAEYQKQNEWLLSEVVTIPASASERLQRLGIPFAPDEGPPDRMDLEQTVAALITSAHDRGLVVKLSIPFTERWLQFAEARQVELISTMNDEADGWLDDAKDQLGTDATVELFNTYANALLAQARRLFTGKVGIGLTHLVDRPSRQPSFFADRADISGFDFLTINPHADPSMQGDAYISFVAKSSQVTQELAAKSGGQPVYLAALMVTAQSEPVRGFDTRAGHAYTDAEEASFYKGLFDATNPLLDGYFLQFSGWESRPAVQVIQTFYRQGRE